MFRLVALCVCVLRASAQTYLPSPTCNQAIQAQANFQLNQFTGEWFQIERLDSMLDHGQCSSTNYTTLAPNMVQVTNREVYNKTAHFFNGTASVVSTDGSGKLDVILPSLGVSSSLPYWVLSTDYANYALVYSCVPYNTTARAIYAWKFGRTPSLNSTFHNAMSTYLSQYTELANLGFSAVDHSTEACQVNSGGDKKISILLVAVIAAVKRVL